MVLFLTPTHIEAHSLLKDLVTFCYVSSIDDTLSYLETFNLRYILLRYIYIGDTLSYPDIIFIFVFYYRPYVKLL